MEWSADGETGWTATAPLHSGTEAGYSHNGLTEGTTYHYRVLAVNGNIPGAWSPVVSATTPAKPNSPATGAPVISGMAQVGGTLTADTSGIADEDGLTNATFAYQWQADGADISRATDSSYILAKTDVGKVISLRVTFTDDAGHEESLTSAAKNAVPAAPPRPLTASMENMPVSHDGESAFTFELRFSEELPVAYRTLRDHAFMVSGGMVKNAGRLEPGSNMGWRIEVRPNENGDVTIILPATGDCDDDGAICTEDGRKLSSRLELSVNGPESQQQQAVQNSPATGAPTITGTAQVGETLTADTSGIADDDGLTNVAYSYQWVSNDGNADTDIQDAAASTYTLADADIGRTIKVRVSFTDDAGNEESLTSVATAEAEAKANSPVTGTPNISGTAQVGETLTADTSGIADADGLDKASFSYKWQADGAEISGATGSAYTLADADEGMAISVKVSFTDDAGNDESLTSAATDAVAAAADPHAPQEAQAANTPATGAPAITGAARVGETLAANTSGIADEDGLTNATFAYQWLAGGADISGAADSTYVPVVDDAGRAIGVRVSFTDDRGFEEALTGAAGTVPADDYTVNEIWETGNWGRVTVGGSATGVVEKPGDRDFFGVNLSRGRTYRIDVAGHGDVGALEQVRLYGVFVYAEDLECSGAYDDPGVTTYVLTAGHSAPHSVAVRAEGDGTGVYRVSVSESDETGAGCDTEPVPTAQAANTPATGAPTVTGTVRVGETLTADTSGIADEDGLDKASFSYQWLAGDAEISGATGSVYTLADADKGKAISVKVSFTDDAGNAETLTSAATAAVEAKANSPATGQPAISGTAQVGEKLTADTSGIADEDGLTSASFAYQWQAEGVEISVATDDTYTLADADEGKAITVTVSFTDDAGNAEELTSGPTAEVAARPNTPATGLPTISGTALVGETLTAETSAIADEDGLDNAVFAYQWQSEGVDISGSTGETYTQADAEVGKVISVRVSFTDDAGNDETLTSGPTDAVEAKANSPATGLPAITGTTQVGETLTADVSGISDDDGLSNAVFSYQWQADGAELSGATGSAYTLADADVGKAVSVTVSFTDDAGNAETLTSAATAAVDAKPNAPATGQPAISGTALVGETLTADTSGIADADGLTNAAFSYQWVSNDGNADTDISGATDSTYTPVEADVGKVISVKVAFNDDAGNGEESTSAATEAVEARPNSPATGAPAISGTAQAGETLTAETSGIADEDGLTNAAFAYQWQADGADISGSTGETYTLADADEGKAVTVTVSFTDDAGNAETLTSPATGEVAAARGGICDRTQQVQDAILKLLPDIDDCAVVTDADLSGVRGSYFSNIDRHIFFGVVGNTRTLKPGDFRGLSNVGHLTLATVELEELPTGVFDGLPSLETLGLGTNNLSELPEDLFDGLSKLHTLRVSSNDLDALPENVFDGLSNLEVLSLWGNNLTALPEDVFDGLSSLTTLWLSKNSLSELPADIFDGLSDLELLVLDDNDLSALPENVFDGLSNLDTISLEGNDLRTVPGGVFGDLSSLTGLDLRENSLDELPEDAFEGLSKLDGLNLTHNALRELPADLFDGLSSLEGLFLNNNKLSELPDGIFEGLSRLNRLSLLDNPGTPFTIMVELEGQGDSTFVVKADKGAPVDIGVTLSVQGGTIPQTEITIDGGSLQSQPIAVSRTDEDGTQATISMQSAIFQGLAELRHGGIPTGGFQIGLGEPLVLGDAEAVNSPATGAPAISGTAQVSQTLTADASGIVDADGLTNTVFSYQWLSSRDTEIGGATSSTYTLQASDASKVVKVRVTFTDDAGNNETLTSAATAAVAAAPTPNSPAPARPRSAALRRWVRPWRQTRPGLPTPTA